MTKERARELAEAELTRIPRAIDAPLVLFDAQAIESERLYVFAYNTQRFVETRDPLDGLVGNGPIVVDRETGATYRVPTGGWKRWIAEYDRTGHAPATHPRS